MKLPEIGKTQSWCCENGCGECKPVMDDFEYSRTEDMAGNLIESKTEVVWVSNCCKADLMLWDEDKQNFVDFEMVEETASELLVTTVPVVFENSARDDAYDKIDSFLRNSLDDEDYAAYSDALEMCFNDCSAVRQRDELLNVAVGLVRVAESKHHEDDAADEFESLVLQAKTAICNAE